MGSRSVPNGVPLTELARLTGDPVTVAPDATVTDHLRAGVDTRLRNLVAHDPGTRDGTDPEELHQMRVSVRRIRAMLKTGRPWLDRAWSKPLLRELGWLGRCLGPVRDLDVLLERIRHDAEEFGAEERELVERLATGLERQRADARATMLAELDSARYRDLLAGLAEFVHRPLPATRSSTESEVDDHTALLKLLRDQFRIVREAVENEGRTPTDERLHALRLLGKRLRYTAELAATTGDESVRRLVSRAKEFQDVLGEHQDACVAEDRIRALLTEIPDDTRVAFAAGRLVERERARRAVYRDEWWEHWKRVRKAAEKV